MVNFGIDEEYVYRINKEKLSICNENPFRQGNPSVLKKKKCKHTKHQKNKGEKN